MKSLLPLLWTALTLLALTACEDNADDVDNSEFTYQWAERNAAYFTERMNEAAGAIAQARAEYGDAWADHCDWRIYRSYAKLPGGPATDSICVHITERGTGTATPLYTDSVRVNFTARLIPTTSYPEGKVVSYSGIYPTDEYVFNPDFSQPVSFAVSNLVEGYTTALLYMHVGDRCTVYMGQEMAYGTTSSGDVPAYSAMVFDIQLKGIYRKK